MPSRTPADVLDWIHFFQTSLRVHSFMAGVALGCALAASELGQTWAALYFLIGSQVIAVSRAFCGEAISRGIIEFIETTAQEVE